MQITKTLNLNKVIQESSSLRRIILKEKLISTKTYTGSEVISYQDVFITLLQNAINKSKQIQVKHGQNCLGVQKQLKN